MNNDKEIIERIKVGKGLTIKYMKHNNFTFNIMKYIIENCDFNILLNCYENIPKAAIKDYHSKIQIELKNAYEHKIPLSKQFCKNYIKYIKIDKSSVYDKWLYNYYLKWGSDIN